MSEIQEQSQTEQQTPQPQQVTQPQPQGPEDPRQNPPNGDKVPPEGDENGQQQQAEPAPSPPPPPPAYLLVPHPAYLPVPPPALNTPKPRNEEMNALILSMYYLGATSSRFAVMRSDAISEGKRFTSRFRATYFNGGKYNLGMTFMKKLLTEEYVKHYPNNVIKDKVFFLSEKGNAAAKELIQGDIPQGSYLISYKKYEKNPVFEDIKTAILCTLYANDATAKEKGVLYPFIVTEINFMVKNIRGMDDKVITPEYAGVFELIKNKFVEKTFEKDEPDKYFLTSEGKSKAVRSLSDPKAQGYLKIAKDRNDKHTKKKTPEKKGEEVDTEVDTEVDEEGILDDILSQGDSKTNDTNLESPEPKRARLEHNTPPLTPLGKQQTRETGQKKKALDDSDEVKIIGVKRGEIIFLDDNDTLDEPTKKKTFLDLTDSSKIIVLGDSDTGASNGVVGTTEDKKDAPQSRSRVDLEEIDLRNAQKYPSLKIDQAFSLVSPLSGITTSPKVTGIKLIVDSREPKYMKEKVQAKFAEENLPCELRSLSAGDYIWVATGIDGKEYLLNAIIERKTVPDFDARYKHNGSYYDQVMKMRETGISNLIYLIEGVFNREHTFHNKSFDELQQCIRNVQEQDHLKLIRTLSQEETVSFLVEITKSLVIMAREGRITEEFFAYPLRDLKGLKDRHPMYTLIQGQTDTRI